MTSERASAYGRVMKFLEDVGPTKLLAPERDRVREAADALLFSEDAADAATTLADVRELTRHLVESDRWIAETADALVRDLEAAGPLTPALR